MNREANKLAKSALDYSMANAEMEMTQVYLENGRRLERFTAEELKDEFVASYEAWAHNFDDPAIYQRVTFVQSEYAIRKLPSPDELVKHVMGKITNSIRGMYEGERVNRRSIIEDYKADVKHQH